jgi:Flp pilus assembly pilin Flp
MTLEANMLHMLRTLLRDDDGQDLIEYTLLITFVVIVTAGVFSIGGTAIKGIVNTSNSQITYANQFSGS